MLTMAVSVLVPARVIASVKRDSAIAHTASLVISGPLSIVI